MDKSILRFRKFNSIFQLFLLHLFYKQQQERVFAYSILLAVRNGQRENAVSYNNKYKYV